MCVPEALQTTSAHRVCRSVGLGPSSTTKGDTPSRTSIWFHNPEAWPARNPGDSVRPYSSLSSSQLGNQCASDSTTTRRSDEIQGCGHGPLESNGAAHELSHVLCARLLGGLILNEFCTALCHIRCREGLGPEEYTVYGLRGLFSFWKSPQYSSEVQNPDTPAQPKSKTLKPRSLS